MESPELTCKKIANKLFYYLSKEFQPFHVIFVEEGKSLSSLEGAQICSIDISALSDVESAAKKLLTKIPRDFESSIELLIPPNITGIVVTANNISLRVLKSPFEQSFLATICWK